MSTHSVTKGEVARALGEYVQRRDSVTGPQMVKINQHCEIVQIGRDDAPLFTVELTPVTVSPGGKS